LEVPLPLDKLFLHPYLNTKINNPKFEALGFRRIREDSGGFRKIQEDSGGFRSIPLNLTLIN
jgi:hypothetical protein